MNEILKYPIRKIREALKNKEFTAKELTLGAINAMEKQRELNAFVLETPEIALKQAEEADKNIASGNMRLLEGIPIGVKDLYCTKNVRTTNCSKMLADFVPEYESTVTTNLFNQGGVMIGKTNMDEFAMGSSNTTSYFGNVINPWVNKTTGEKVVPGGSSGGSAAAVAANICFSALASDTGGSVRQPASYCGIVGVKPTYGRCSRWGMIAFSSSLDQAALFTRNIDDAAFVLQSIMGHDKKDSTSAMEPIPDLVNSLDEYSIKGKKFGIPKEFFEMEVSSYIKSLYDDAIKAIEELGGEIKYISLPYAPLGLGAYYIIAPAEASSNLARYDGVRYGLRVCNDDSNLDEMYELTRTAGFGAEVKRRIMIGTYVLSSKNYDKFYLQAQRVRRLIYNDFVSAFKEVDAIITPATISEAFALDKKLTPVEMYRNDLFTIPPSLAGLPCLSIPVKLSPNGLPLGLQIVTRHFDEVSLFKYAKALENSFSFKVL